MYSDASFLPPVPIPPPHGVVSLSLTNMLPHLSCHYRGCRYRSGQPNEVNFPFLEKLKLRAVVYISPEDPSEQL